MLGTEDPYPWAEIWSSYQGVWTRNETTTFKERVEPPDDINGRIVDLAKGYAEKSKRIGWVNRDKLMGMGAYQPFEAAFEGFETVEVTNEFNAIRQIKTPFEIEAMQQNGAILDASWSVPGACLRGARYWDACAAVEGFVKSLGAFWGRTKLSLDITPYTVPTAKDLTMKEDDIINFEIVYESPWGYWLEMTTVFSFIDLPGDIRPCWKGTWRQWTTPLRWPNLATRSG